MSAFMSEQLEARGPLDLNEGGHVEAEHDFKGDIVTLQRMHKSRQPLICPDPTFLSVTEGTTYGTTSELASLPENISRYIKYNLIYSINRK